MNKNKSVQKPATAKGDAPKADAPKAGAPLSSSFAESFAADVFSIPGAQKAQEQVRSAVEGGLGQFRQSIDTAQATMEKNGAALQGTFEAVAAHSREVGEKSLELVKANAAATLAFTSALFQARSFSDLIELQSSHARKTMESLLTQGKEMASLAQKGAADIGAKAKALLPANA
jgi:phasin